MHRLALRAEDARGVHEMFESFEPNEAGAFFLLRSGQARTGTRLVASKPRIPKPEEFRRVGPAMLTPSSQLISQMVSWANREKAGLLFVHSHPDPRFPAGFSEVDWEALSELARVMPDLMDGPFAAAVVSPLGWAGTMLADSRWEPIERITAAGRCLQFLESLAGDALPDPMDDRQALALGRINTRLRSLSVAVAGAGGLGSPLAETLTRMGVRSLCSVDDDRLDTPSNLRRIFGARPDDLAEGRLKAEVVRDHCHSLGLGVETVSAALDVRSQEALPHLLEADVILCGTDTHSSRAVLNAVSYAFHLPLIDCGVRPGLRRDGGLESLAGEIRIVGAGLPCLFCRKALNSETIREENLPPDERRRLAREGYGSGTLEVVPSVSALTVSGAGWMAGALIGLLADDGDHRPAGYQFDVLNGTAWESIAARRASCVCRLCEGRGTAAPLGLR